MLCSGRLLVAAYTLALVATILAALTAAGSVDIPWGDFYWMLGAVVALELCARLVSSNPAAGVFLNFSLAVGMCVWNLVGGFASDAEAGDDDEPVSVLVWQGGA